MIRCPACKADTAQGPACRRCKADLALLFELEERRAALLAVARAEAGAGRWREAAEAAGEADALRHGDDAARLLAVAALMGGDHRQAWRWYWCASASSQSPP